MKTVVLMGLSCLLLAGVFCILSKRSQANNISLFSQAIHPVETGKTSTELSTVNSENKVDTSNLIDSHWLDDESFQKAVEDDLLTENEMQEAEVPGVDPETIHPVSPKKDKKDPVTEHIPSIRQLILELEPDTTANKTVPVEVV
jgi:hypothetical protein